MGCHQDFWCKMVASNTMLVRRRLNSNCLKHYIAKITRIPHETPCLLSHWLSREIQRTEIVYTVRNEAALLPSTLCLILDQSSIHRVPARLYTAREFPLVNKTCL